MALSNNTLERLKVGLGDPNAGTEVATNLAQVANATPGAPGASVAVLTDANGGVAFTGRLSTTDGVASGTVKVIGGLAYNAVADSTAVTSTSTETMFDAQYAIPANTLKAGSIVKIKGTAIRTGVNSTDTAIFNTWLATNTTAGSLAGTTFTTSSTTNGAANDIFDWESTIVCRTAGSSGTLVASSSVVKVEAASNTATRVQVLTNSTAVNTQTAQTIGVSVKFNSTNAGNSAVLRILSVEVT